MGEFDVRGPELKKLIKLAKRQPLAFAYNPGKGPEEDYFGLHRRKPPKLLGKTAKSEGPGKKVAFGMATLDGTVLSLACEIELPTMARKVKKFLKTQKVTLNVEILGPDGQVLESDIEDGLEEDPDMAEDDAAPATDETAAEGAGQAEADAPVAPDGFDIEGMTAQVEELGAQVAGLAPAMVKVFEKPLGQLTAMLEAKDGPRLEAGIKKVSLAVEKAKRSRTPEGDPPSDPPDGAADGADPEAARWAELKAKLEPQVAEALQRNAGDVGKIRAVWALALERGEGGKFGDAIKAAAAIEKLLAAASGAAPEGAAAGTVEKRKKELTTGKEILAEFAALREDLKEAVKILPERMADAKAFTTEISSAVSSNDLDQARVTLTKVEMLIAQAKTTKERATAEFAEVSTLVESALQSGTGDLDQLRAVFAFAQEKMANLEMASAFKSFEKLRELAQAALGAETSQAQDAAAAGAAMAETIKGLEDAEALRAELAALKERLDAVITFIPAKTDRAAKLFEKADAASRTDDMKEAKKHLTAYAQIVAEGEYEQTVITKRKEGLLASLAKIANPDGALPEEIAQLDAQRKIVTEALAADAPETADFGRATEALRAMDSLIEVIVPKAAIRVELAEVLANRDVQKAEFDRLMALPPDTVVAAKLQRALQYQYDQIAVLCKGDSVPPAQDMLTAMVKTIADLAAEEAEINKATALREQALREHAALKAQLDLARTIYEVTPAFKADVDAFKEADAAAGSYLNDKNYARALGAIDLLKRATAKLNGRKTEFDTAAALRKDVMAKKVAIQPLLAQQSQTIERTAELGRLGAERDALETAYKQAIKDSDWTTAQTKLVALDGICRQIIALKGASDALAADEAEVVRRYQATDLAAEMLLLKREGLLEFSQAKEAYEAKDNEIIKAFNTDKDVALALTLLPDLEALLAELQGLNAANSAALKERKKIEKDYVKASKKTATAYQVKPQTDKMLGLYTAFEAAEKDFVDTFNGRGPDARAKLDTLIAAAEAVIAEKAENDKAKAAAKKACDDREVVVEPEVDDGIDLKNDHEPDLDDLGQQLIDGWDDYADYYNKERFSQALEVLERLNTIAAQVKAGVGAAQAEMARRKTEFEGKYLPAFVARLDEVHKFEAINTEIGDLRINVRLLKTEAEAAAASDDYHIALEKFAELEPQLIALEALKPQHDQLVIDRNWVNTEWAKITADITTARAMSGVDRETQDKVVLFKAADNACYTAYDEDRFADSRAAFPALKTATAELIALKAQHDTAKIKKDAVNVEWAKIATDHETASKMRALTPELEKLVADFKEAHRLFQKTYFGHDYDAALVHVADLGTAITALLAKQADHAAADTAAGLAATQAETEIDALSEAELKGKTTEEKLDLLETLRGQKQKLTDKQREMQRKIYMAMEMDPEFVKLDDERRDELKDAIRNDKDLQAARAAWAETDGDKFIPPERKIALLTKTLQKECEIYGMPMPAVQTFSEPPGDLGSFDPSNNVININIHEEATFDDFFDTIDTIVHENAHNYQDHLVLQLEEGLLKPGDPEYTQALMFAANSGPHAYVTGKEDRACYEKQPLEEHAWKTGGDVQDALKKGPSL